MYSKQMAFVRNFQLIHSLRRAAATVIGNITACTCKNVQRSHIHRVLLMIISSLPFHRGTFVCISALDLSPAGEMSRIGELKIICARLAEKPDWTCWYTRKNTFPPAFSSPAVIFIRYRAFLQFLTHSKYSFLIKSMI